MSVYGPITGTAEFRYIPASHSLSLDKSLALYSQFKNLTTLRLGFTVECLPGVPGEAIFQQPLEFLPCVGQLKNFTLPNLCSLSIDFSAPNDLFARNAGHALHTVKHSWRSIQHFMASNTIRNLQLDWTDFDAVSSIDFESTLAPSCAAIEKLSVSNPANAAMDDGRIGDLVKICPRLSDLVLDLGDCEPVNPFHITSVILSNQPLKTLTSLSIVKIDAKVLPPVSFAVMFPALRSLHLQIEGEDVHALITSVYTTPTPCPALQNISLVTRAGYPELTSGNFDHLQTIFACFADTKEFPNLRTCCLESELGDSKSWTWVHDGGLTIDPAERFPIIYADFEAMLAIGPPSSVQLSYYCAKVEGIEKQFKAVRRREEAIEVEWWGS